MTKPNYILHYGILISILILTFVRIILWNTPNNELHELGLGNAVALDLTVGALFAFILAMISLFCRKSAPSKSIFLISQFLTWTNSIGVWVILVGIGLYAGMSGL